MCGGGLEEGVRGGCAEDVGREYGEDERRVNVKGDACCVHLR